MRAVIVAAVVAFLVRSLPLGAALPRDRRRALVALRLARGMS